MATKVGNLVPEDITLLRVNILNVNIHATKEYMDKPVKHEGLEMKTGYDIALNISENACRIRLFFAFDAVNDQKKVVGLKAEIGLEYHFKVREMNRFIDKDQRLSLSVAASLINIAYSTSRGIILEKTQNTYFHGIIIPVVNSTKLLPNAQ